MVDNGRDPYTKVVMSKLARAYYLPGVSVGITTVDDITVLTPTQIVDQYGRNTEFLSTLTTPTTSTYEATEGTWVVAEPSVVRRWMGNIYERTTRYVLAE